MNGLSLIDHNDWQKVSRGLPLLPPSGIVPPRGPQSCVPTLP
ncbi:MAG TPA: hypothetical protein VFD92_14290 [Candidatus Binatia bacterium]|nr:hypothetical protein [Candidatus Binatia bacterium]